MVIRPVVPEGFVHKVLLESREAMASRLAKHGPGAYVDGHHALGIITEEWKELVDALQAGDQKEVRKELFDVAIAALFAIASMDFIFHDKAVDPRPSLNP
jgi:NTP pyrophosphatase (non-canonical NTP hydrolase)